MYCGQDSECLTSSRKRWSPTLVRAGIISRNGYLDSNAASGGKGTDFEMGIIWFLFGTLFALHVVLTNQSEQSAGSERGRTDCPQRELGSHWQLSDLSFVNVFIYISAFKQCKERPAPDEEGVARTSTGDTGCRVTKSVSLKRWWLTTEDHTLASDGSL